MVHGRLLVAPLLAVSVAAGPTGAGQAEMFRLDGSSQVVIHVGKAGVFGFAGHDHEIAAPVTGTVTVDRADLTRSRVALAFESGALKVTGRGEPAGDVPEVQRVMLSDRVLDADRYPRIAFTSRRVSSGGQAGRALKLSIEGDLELHGVTRPCLVTALVTLVEDTLTAEGKAEVKQSDFGIEPVTAAGGTVRVKDTVEVTFEIRATRSSEG